MGRKRLSEIHKSNSTPEVGRKSPRLTRRSARYEQILDDLKIKRRIVPELTINSNQIDTASPSKSRDDPKPVSSPLKQLVPDQAPVAQVANQPKRRGRKPKSYHLTNQNVNTLGTSIPSSKISASVKTVKAKGHFVCSVCNMELDTESRANRHILTDHYGLARINDPQNPPFTSSEKVRAYTNALKVLPFLSCKKCGKHFRSGLGLKMHEDICGKSEQERNVQCEICGKTLKQSSMRSHVRIHVQKSLPASPTKTAAKASPINQDSIVNTSLNQDPIGGSRPIRNSARKAMQKFIESSSESEDDPDHLANAGSIRKRKNGNDANNNSTSQSNLEQKAKKKYRCNKTDDELSFSDGSLSADETDSYSLNSNEGVTGNDQEAIPVYYDYDTERSTLSKLLDQDPQVDAMFNTFTTNFDLIYSNARSWPLPDELSEEQSEKHQYFGFWRCPATCGQLFETLESVQEHFLHCGLDAEIKCQHCSFINQSKLLLLQHLFNEHKDKLPQILIKPPKSRTGHKSSSGFSLPKFTSTSSSSIKPNDFWEFTKKNFNRTVFDEWMPRPDHFKLVPDHEFELYLPPTQRSPSLRFVKRMKSSAVDTTAKEWATLSLFEHASHVNHITVFTGGPVYSGAWCPFPINSTMHQVLCISTTSSDSNQEQRSNQTQPVPGLLQFWQFDRLEMKNGSVEECRPTLAFAIAHNYGVIWDMKWCPGGTSFVEQPHDPGHQWPRLGLLAIACADGQCRILSIPFSEYVRRHFNISDHLRPGPVFECQPTVVLVSPPRCPSLLDGPAISRTLSWGETDRQKKVAVGYGNGLVAVFDLSTKSSLLVKQVSDLTTQLLPIKTWIAHGAIVNSLKWLPYSGCEHLITGSFDRNVKLWNLKDLSSSIVIQKRGIVTKVDYVVQWCGVFFAHDDCYMNLHNHIMFRGLSPEQWNNSLSKHKGCVWDFSLSNWLNAEASVDFAGEAVINLNFMPNGRNKTRRRKRMFECPFLPLYHIECDSLSSEKENKQNHSPKSSNDFGSHSYLIRREFPAMRSSEAFSSVFGLTFHDADLNEVTRLPTSELNRIKSSEQMNYARLCDFPLVSINKVEWNPNRQYCNWLYTSGESGITRISCIPILSASNESSDESD